MLRRIFRHVAVVPALLGCCMTMAQSQGVGATGGAASDAVDGGAIVAPVKRVKPKSPVIEESPPAQGHTIRKIQLVPDTLECDAGFVPDRAQRTCIAEKRANSDRRDKKR